MHLKLLAIEINDYRPAVIFMDEASPKGGDKFDENWRQIEAEANKVRVHSQPTGPLLCDGKI